MSATKQNQELSSDTREEFLKTLRIRFMENMNRHKGIDWEKVREKLESRPGKLWTLREMDLTGGEPDVVSYDEATDEYIFYDCSPESPKGRRSLCYDKEALEARKKFPPKDSAVNMASSMGIELLSEEEYTYLQSLGEYDLKTSSWVKTTGDVRKRGGALFGDCRYGRVFFYHNGADSYYESRGFRGVLRV